MTTAKRRAGESEAITQGIRVRVRSRYVPERSNPENGDYFFAYQVTISNEGSVQAQLLNRHWIITDANGGVHEVQGEGVVGEQPVLDPGEAFEYTSACPLKTAFGTMHGSYEMITAEDERFEAEIAPFLLGEPQSIH